MRLLLRSNDPVVLSFAESLLGRAGIAMMVADRAMSVLEGSLGILPRRILVADADWVAAVRLLRDADLGEWVARDDDG